MILQEAASLECEWNYKFSEKKVKEHGKTKDLDNDTREDENEDKLTVKHLIPL